MAKTIDIGAVAEHRFAAEALSKGKMVSWPSSQMHPYDMIIDTGTDRLRIQVKGSEITRPKVEFSLRMKSGPRRKRGYTKADTDFIVLYLFHYDTWYILPVEDARQNLTITPSSKKCPYQKYANAWHLLT